MSLRPIVKLGAPVLRNRSKELDPAFVRSPECRRIAEDMLETMDKAKGVGIAAPQIGLGIRLFIAESPDGPIALANPIFTKMSKKMLKDEEGCLSVPGHFDTVLRHKSLHVEALTLSGEKIVFDAEGHFARVLQHEMDHLDGVLFIDRVEEQKKPSPKS
jgi:peptide deformylase